MSVLEPNHWTVLKTNSVHSGDLLKKALAYGQAGDAAGFSKAFILYTEAWQQIVEDVGAYGLFGLQDVCMLFHEALSNLCGDGETLDENRGQLLADWQTLFIEYLESPDIEGSGNALVRHLQNQLWTNPLPDDDAAMLTGMLMPEPAQTSGEPQGSAESAVTSEPDGSEEFTGADSDSMLNFQISSEASTTPVNPELIEMVREQFKIFADSLIENLAPDNPESADTEGRILVLEEHVEKLETLGKALDTVGLFGINRAIEYLLTNLTAFLADKVTVTEDEFRLLKATSGSILGYLEAVDDPTRSAQLVDDLRKPQWPNPLAESDAVLLTQLFDAVELGSSQYYASAKKTEALAEDVSLTIPEGVNQDLLDSLLNELPTLTADFSQAIQGLMAGGSLGDVETAQRIAHTLKGSGNIVGIKGISTMTHHIEDILEQFTQHRSIPPSALAENLMDAADCLEAMSDALLGTGQAPDDAREVFQKILDWGSRDIMAGVEETPDREQKPSSAPVNTLESEAEKPASTQAQESLNAAAMTRVPSSLVDDMLRLAGEGTIHSGQVQEQLDQAIERSRLVQEQNQQLQQLISELEQLVNIRGFASRTGKQSLNEEFDPLEMDQYNELHTCSHRLTEVATDSRELSSGMEDQLTHLKDLVLRQDRLQKENQELVLRTRMVPVKTIVSRCQRAIRQACRVVQKQVELNIIGADTLMDSEVLNGLVDPLMHVLRNAVDHGIESSERREKAGKDPSGHITLEFARTGNQILVTCRDDGAGLDYEKIRRTAEKKGLIEVDQKLSDDEFNRLILTPGFSTRSSATQISGRGIGMDAVREHVLKMKGNLSVYSETGHGCRIELTLPATLVSVQALLLQCGGQMMAISNRGLEQILYPGAGVLQSVGDAPVYQFADQVYPAQRLEPLLGMPISPETTSKAPSALLIKDEGGETRAILVEQVVDSRDLVVKNMGKHIPTIPGIVGATILGDGSVTPVLDIPELLGRGADWQVSAEQVASGPVEANASLPVALVVDDSLSARRSLAQFLNDTIGFEVKTAIDGIDAIEQIEVKKPAIFLVDMEMPRMNGIELTEHIRNREDTKNTPVIMITSRSTEKHRRQAEAAGVNAYVTKPYSEDELLRHVNAFMEQT